jgi:hypothetical protein
LSVPILDGAFKPNNLLEDAEVILEKPGLEDMALAPDGRLFLAAGSEVLAFDGKFTQVIARHDGLITALAVLADGRHAVALGDRIIVQGQPPITRAVDRSFKAITALTPDSGDRILVCDASADHACDKWQYDLMNKGNTGRLVIMDPVSGNANLLHSKLGWPCGALPTGTGTLVSESWRHRLHWAGKGDASVELPGYPARITSTADGGFWLSLFSGRAQIVEFILSENVFRAEMMTTIDPKYWVCPALSSGEDFLEPMQSGGVKNMGILKPWAPPRSYGLAVRFTADRNPLMSIHSRVGGRNHGIVTTLEKGNDIYALSKGAGRLLRLNLQAIRAANGLEGSAK